MNMISSVIAGFLFTTLTASAAFGQGFEINPKLKQSKVAYAGMQAVFDFVKGYQKAHDRLPTNELVGFHAGTEADEYEVGVYHLVKPKRLAANLFGCHFHFEDDGSIENAHCHDEKKQAINDYEPAPRMFKIAEFQDGLVAAVDYFAKKHGKVDDVSDLKMWHANKALEFTFLKGEGEHAKKIHVMCHYHGDEEDMDCHGHNRVGDYEPGDA